MKHSLSLPHFVRMFAITLLLSLATASSGLAVDSAGELACQMKTGLAVGKFIREKARCIDNCWKLAFAGTGSAADCAPPYGGSTASCIASSESKAASRLQSGCARDCPECYSGGDCPADAVTRIADAEAHVEALVADVYCDDSASGDGLTLSEFKCQRTVQKMLAHFAAAEIKCYSRCRKSEVGGKIDPGNCAPPLPADLRTQECLAEAWSKAAFLIEKKCESTVNPSGEKPECGPYPARNGVLWASAEQTEVDSRVPSLFCDDPTTP